MDRRVFPRMLALSCTLLMAVAHAGELSHTEADALQQDVQSLLSTLTRGDVDTMIDRSHASVKRFAGGEEAYATSTRDTLKALKDTGLKIISDEAGSPTRTYAAGSEEVCFVPRTTVFTLDGQTVKSLTFMVAVRQRGGSTWSYIDGAAMHAMPQLLRQLLPDLEADVTLPPVKVEPH